MRALDRRTALGVAVGLVLTVAFAGAARANDDLRLRLLRALDVAAGFEPGDGSGREHFVLPHASELDALPQHPDNSLTRAKVKLGRMLFHDTAFGTETTDPWREGSYGCATCHHAAAGFKAGVPQGIADGGEGFGPRGRDRRLAHGLDPEAPAGDPNLPDLQPVASPSVLNSAWTSVVLWDGAFGNGGGANAGVDAATVAAAGPPPIKANAFELPGLETQALAGTFVHRLRFDDGSLLQTQRRYRRLWDAAYPSGGVPGFSPVAGSGVSEQAYGAALAIAAYERTVTASRAPFQRWLRGRRNAMSRRQLEGALLFFGKAGCSECHTGPALASREGAPDAEVFMSVGFADFNTSRPRVHGSVPESAANGRGGFTGRAEDVDRFKVAQLYNLRDARALGHGASFSSVREVIEYKNAAVPQDPDVLNLDPRFRALDLSEREIGRLTAFVKHALYDPNLARHVPKRVPSGECFPANDLVSIVDGGCD